MAAHSKQWHSPIVTAWCECRTSWLLKTFVGSGYPCLLVGESGTSKSVTISNFLAGLDAASNITLNMNFSSRTSSWDVQRAVDGSVEKRTKVALADTSDILQFCDGPASCVTACALQRVLP